MSSDKNKTPKLPDGWVLCNSKSTPGRKYYFNKKTGKSSWTEPQADNRSSEKHKSKRPKPSSRDRERERKRKEEAQKKNLKRKSDGTGAHTSPKKKCNEEKEKPRQSLNNSAKNESPAKSDTNKRHSTSKPNLQKESADKKDNEKAEVKEDSSSRESTGARDSLSSVDSPAKGTPSKNIANSRLAQLRAQLNSDIQMEENKDKSPVKTKRKSPIETDTKVAKTEKSPTISESKCTTQSPNSESLHSIPSPSQFFAANKIISSMMAQLPDEYCDKIKQKDTFAEIEQGICSQVNDYPNVKHPVTPPQFSEASKLVSAIKSKLSGREGSLRTYTTAKERLEVLRTRLSNEAADSSMEDSIMSDSTFPTEAMDVDCKEIKTPTPAAVVTKETVNNNENVVLVVDTNIFIHELDFIKNVLNSHIKGYSEQPTLLVPWRVINELDRLKDNNNGNGAICKRAKSAMDYLYKSLPENERIKGQSLRDANSHIYPCELPDDEILNCCLQQVERGKSVILLSNDKNLCNKACINNVKCIGIGELKTLLESKPQSTTDPDLITGLKHCESAVYQLLANILENEMRAKYNNLWQHVLFKAPPWSLADVLQCLLKHWVAVFSDVFPRIEHLIADLRAALLAIDKKDQNMISQSEVTNFKELCLDIARKCQIIPEYMELAKTTVEQLTRKCDVRDPEMIVIDAFEGVWRILSSYCAKLSTLLGIPHNVEDKMPGEEAMDVLTSKFQLFEAQISGLANAIKGILSSECLEACPSEAWPEEALSQLELALKESLTSVQLDNAVVTRHNLTLFCTKCRNMLQEAYAKFAQLTELLDVCKNTFADVNL